MVKNRMLVALARHTAAEFASLPDYRRSFSTCPWIRLPWGHGLKARNSICAVLKSLAVAHRLTICRTEFFNIRERQDA
jgi:hypothetical protein